LRILFKFSDHNTLSLGHRHWQTLNNTAHNSVCKIHMSSRKAQSIQETPFPQRTSGPPPGLSTNANE
jgi:hypothetical protein